MNVLRPTVNQALTPAIGDVVWLCPDAGYHAAPAWFRVTGYRDAVVLGQGYVTGWLIDEAERRVTTLYVKVSELIIRRNQW